MIRDRLLSQFNQFFPKGLSSTQLANALNLPEETVKTELNELMTINFPLTEENRSYRLKWPIYTQTDIQSQLNTKVFGKHFELHTEIPSTNEYAKENLNRLPHGSIIIAYGQTKGKGRLNRQWSTPIAKSLALTLVIKKIPQTFHSSLLSQLMAAATINALTHFIKSDNIKVKWPNDILIHQKKLAGILIEAEFSNNECSGIVIGLGLNINTQSSDLPYDIRQSSISLNDVTDHLIDSNDLIVKIITEFEKLFNHFENTGDSSLFLKVCRLHSSLINQLVVSHEPGRKREVKVLDINSDGSLQIKDIHTHQQDRLISSEISIRGIDGQYI